MEVKVISPEEHLTYIHSRPSVSFLQTPAWGQVKREWQSKSLGWFTGDKLVGAGLLLLRKVPKIDRYFAYLPEGPDLDWQSEQHVEQALGALVEFAKNHKVFQIKIGPHVWVKRWQAETLKAAIATERSGTISELSADESNGVGVSLAQTLRRIGWKQPPAADANFGDYQPRYVFQVALGEKTVDDVFNGFNQLWRRNIRKAEKSEVQITTGDFDALPDFHNCYVETAQRDGFTPRPLQYFENMYRAMKAEDSKRIELYLARHHQHLGAIAATTMTQVGNHAWYSYGASTTAARDLRPSNAIQWHMMQQAISTGCTTYDLRGIANTLDQNHHLFGLIQFKLGTGGYAQEYVGEWDYNISPALAKAFAFYMGRRN